MPIGFILGKIVENCALRIKMRERGMDNAAIEYFMTDFRNNDLPDEAVLEAPPFTERAA